MLFPDRLTALMKERRVNKLGLSKDIGVSDSLIGSWCKGEKKPSLDNILRLADFFGVSVDYLLCRSNERVPSFSLGEHEVELFSLFRALPDVQKEFYINALRGAANAPKPASVMPMYAVARGGKTDIEVTDEVQREAVNTLFDNSYGKGGKRK